MKSYWLCLYFIIFSASVFAQVPDTSAIIINELMVNPKKGQPVYIEIYNRSERYMQLNGLEIGRITGGSLIAHIPIVTRLVILNPKSYYVITPAADSFSLVYPQVLLHKIIELRNLPFFGLYSGNVVLAKNKVPIETVFYGRNMPGFGAKQNPGYSLQRVSPVIPAADSLNWAYSSDSSVYGTPADVNYIPSQNKGIPALTGISQDETLVFTPDNDGLNDKAIIYEFPGSSAPGHVSADVFDKMGRKVKSETSLISQYDKLKIEWDGLNDYGMLVPEGSYVIAIFAKNGLVKKREVVMKLAY
jgi:Lamin Tail Domain